MLGLTLLYMACAQQVPLTGGPKDEVPPQLDTIESIPNNQIHFEKQDINLYFDEFVDLKDAAKQILISPPPTYPPIIDNRLKKVSVKFNEKEKLKEQTTYVINFGESITDFTEGNKLQNFTFVFSTGDFIDSLSVKGEVHDAFTGEPVKEMVVMLYTNHQDSVIYKEKPYYFARTDEDGKFKINNLRADTFKIAAIGDLNLNYTFDSKSEQIGFLDSLYIINGDTSDIISLEVFKEVEAVNYKSFDVRNQGEIDVSFDPYVDITTIRIIDSMEYYWEIGDKNSPVATLWYAPANRTRVNWEATINGTLDTVTARINLKSVDTIPGPINIVGTGHSRQIGLHPMDTLEFKLSYPIKGIDVAFINAVVTIDSITQDTISIDWIEPSQPTMKLKATSDWSAEKEMDIQFLPGAIIDFYNKTNDTIDYKVKVAKEEDFSSIELQFENFDSSTYIIQLLEKEKFIKDVMYTPGDSLITLEKLNPLDYNLVIIKDRNQNGRWDPGNYILHQQSERIYRKSLGAIKAGEISKSTLDLLELSSTDKPKPSAEPSETTPRTSRR